MTWSARVVSGLVCDEMPMNNKKKSTPLLSNQEFGRCLLTILKVKTKGPSSHLPVRGQPHTQTHQHTRTSTHKREFSVIENTVECLLPHNYIRNGNFYLKWFGLPPSWHRASGNSCLHLTVFLKSRFHRSYRFLSKGFVCCLGDDERGMRSDNARPFK